MSVLDQASDPLPAQRGGAKALLLTILGEFVLPRDGAAWTSSLVASAATLGVSEKNARQAIARIGEQGLIESARHGRTVRWSLTATGRDLLESGAERIYTFGTKPVDWHGEWLVAHCPVTEQQRSLRNQLRSRLGFLGFGELSASLLVSPHVDREPALRRVLDELGLLDDSIILRSRVTAGADREANDAELVARAWQLDELGDAYRQFIVDQERVVVHEDESAFRATVELVHGWRRFPFTDPELPAELLPMSWVGDSAAQLFHNRHGELSMRAQRWFDRVEAGVAGRCQ